LLILSTKRKTKKLTTKPTSLFQTMPTNAFTSRNLAKWITTHKWKTLGILFLLILPFFLGSITIDRSPEMNIPATPFFRSTLGTLIILTLLLTAIVKIAKAKSEGWLWFSYGLYCFMQTTPGIGAWVVTGCAILTLLTWKNWKFNSPKIR